MKICDKICDILIKELDISQDDINPYESFFEYITDETDIEKIINSLEYEFEISLDKLDLNNIDTIDELEDFIEEIIKEQNE